MPNEEERSPAEQPEDGPAETMAEDREDEAASDEAEALREISEDELKSILAQHEMWLEARNTGYEHGQRADLIRANLQSANLQGAKFRGLFGFVPVTNFAGADLTGARGLTQQQLDEACGDEETKLPPDLTIEPCPDETEKSE